MERKRREKWIPVVSFLQLITATPRACVCVYVCVLGPHKSHCGFLHRAAEVVALTGLTI